MSRDALIAGFLAAQGFSQATARPLAQDASFRRYLRLTGGPRQAVLMDAPPPEDVRPFLGIAAHIAGLGLAAPQIIAADAANGLVLEEDLGDAVMLGQPDPSRFRGKGAPMPAWGSALSPAVATAIDVLVALQRAAPPATLPRWDVSAMAQAALGTLLDWWWPAAFGAAAPAAAREAFDGALAAMLQPLTDGPRGFVHRDFFAGNLIWLPERAGLRRIGILDFQNAALGHPAYDLASLLQDARRDISTHVERDAIAHYLAQRPELEPAAFRTAYAVCSAQRHLRVACQWVRLAVRDGRPHYLAHGPRTWRLLDAALRHPAAAPLAAAMQRWIPPARRGNPPDLAA